VEKSAPSSPAVDATASRAQGESEAQRLRTDAEALKRQAEAELARARSDAEAFRAARVKAEASAAAGRMRAQADAEAARIRAEAEAAAARTKREADAASRATEAAATRTKSDTEAASRAAEIQIVKAKETQLEVAAKSRDSAPSGPTTLASDKISRTAPGDAGRFDGMWNVTIDCPNADGAAGYTFDFVAQVKDGVLRGERGVEGGAGSLRLQGNIQPDGNARLDARGLTSDPKYNARNVPQGAPYAYSVAARFEGSRGTGRRTQLRPCDLTFAKQ